MTGILPPDHIEHYKRQVDMKTENLRSETLFFIKNYYILHKRLPCFPWTFDKSLLTIRLLSHTIGHKNAVLDNLPALVELDLSEHFLLPPGYVPKYSDDKTNVVGGILPCEMRTDRLENDANAFLLQMFTFIHSHFILHRVLPTLPHSFVIGFKYLQLKKFLFNEEYFIDDLPNKLHTKIITELGIVPKEGYIPFTTLSKRNQFKTCHSNRAH
uniref:Uncharacterized protein n=1 Tax=Caenorhabditis japonica TaxID=281687 RepID=A0A8R1E397_CAEJA